MGSAITLALTVLSSLPSLITAGEDVLNLISTTEASLRAMQAENRDPTDAEWQAINDQIAALRAKLDTAAA